MRAIPVILTLGLCAVIGTRIWSQDTDESDLWMMAPCIVTSDNETAWIEGPDADKLNAFLVNGKKFTIRKGKINFSSAEGDTISLKAYTSTGMVLTQKYIRNTHEDGTEE